MRLALTAALIAACCAALPLGAQPVPPAGADAERDALLRALRTACREFSREDQWQQADACRRAFFTAHEEAIWRLNLNPHGPAAGPSS